MSARILVIQFRAPGSVLFDGEPIARVLGGACDLVFKNALAGEVDWMRPEEELRDFDGVILAGSAVLYFDGGDMSDERRREAHTHIAAAVPFIGHMLEHGLPVFGICFGHQLLGHALGARVGYSETEGKTGTYTLRLTDAGIEDSLMRGLPQEFRAQYGHKDVLLELPSGAEVLAHGGGFCRFAAVRFTARAYGVQFHPDFSREDMQRMIVRYSEYAPEDTTQSLFEDTEDGEQLLHNFAALVAS